MGPAPRSPFGLSIIIATFTSLAAACGSTQLYVGGAEGWGSWRSEHFVIHSDASAGATLLATEHLEETYAALAGSFFQTARIPQIEVMLFHEPREYQEVVGDSAGVFVAGIGRSGSVLVMNDAGNRAELERLLAHELTHRFVRAVYPRLPTWLNEGMAMFFESALIEKQRLELGAAPAKVHGLTLASGVDFDQLVRVPPEKLDGPDGRLYYSASWGLVHYLLTGDGGSLRVRFWDLLEAINEVNGDPEATVKAFADIYPDKPVAALDTAIERNNQHFSQPSADTVLLMPFDRPSLAKFEKLARQPDEIGALFAGLGQRRRSPTDNRFALVDQPRFARFELHLRDVERPRQFVVTGGRMLLRHTAAEVELGLGPLGLSLNPRLRQFFEVGILGTFFFTAGGGPLLALDASHGRISRLATGTRRDLTPNPASVAFFGGLAAELGCELRTPSQILLRVALSGAGGWSTAGTTARRDLGLRVGTGWAF